jgi:hypothetical protein
MRTRTRTTRIGSAIAATLAGLGLLSGAGRAQETAGLTWRGKALNPAALPADLGESPRAAITEWEPWARKAGYRMELDAADRILLLTYEKTTRPGAVMAGVARAESWFDEILPSTNPAPPKAAAAPAGAKGSKGAKPATTSPPADIPEDPESAPPVLEPPKAAPGSKPSGTAPKAGATTPWGSGSFAPDSRTGVVIAFWNEKDQESALGHLAKTHADLAGWCATAGKDLGFVIESPLVAAFVENASGQEEWNPDHELLNRVVRLLVLSRFGQMPNWVMHGVAWEAETAFDGSIWVYPYRSEFVYTTEHTAWPTELAHEFQERAKKTLEIDEVANWKRGSWDGSSARHAFGLVHCLAATKRASLPGVLADLRAQRDENNRKPNDDGTWTRNPDWESPPAAQLTILRARCGADVLADVGAWLAKQSGAKARSILQK